MNGGINMDARVRAACEAVAAANGHFPPEWINPGVMRKAIRAADEPVITRLRNALIGMVGESDVEQLRGMRIVVQAQAPSQEEAAIALAAIDALIETST